MNRKSISLTPSRNCERASMPFPIASKKSFTDKTLICYSVLSARMRAFRSTWVLRASAFVGTIVILSPVAPAVAQEKPAGTSTAGNPPKSNGVGLPLPKPPPPTTVTNPDGSTTTTTYSWGGGTTAVTVNTNGETVSTVRKAPLRDGGLRTEVITGNTSVTLEYDNKGTIRSLVKTNLDTRPSSMIQYDDKGQRVKATVSRTPLQGNGELLELYEAQNTPSGRPERYNKDKDKFETIMDSDWPSITDRL